MCLLYYIAKCMQDYSIVRFGGYFITELGVVLHVVVKLIVLALMQQPLFVDSLRFEPRDWRVQHVQTRNCKHDKSDNQQQCHHAAGPTHTHKPFHSCLWIYNKRWRPKYTSYTNCVFLLSFMKGSITSMTMHSTANARITMEMAMCVPFLGDWARNQLEKEFWFMDDLCEWIQKSRR